MARTWKINKKGFHILFIGDSKIEQSIYDADRSEIKTFAQSGDNYLYTYSKLKKILKDNPLIDTVFVGLDCHNIDLDAIKWYSSQTYLDYKFPQCFPFMDFDDFKILFKCNPTGFVKCVPNLFNLSDLQFKKDYIDLYGSFQGSDLVLNSKENNRIIYINKSSFSLIQFYYLNRIINMCISKDIKPILLTTPVNVCEERNIVLEKKIIEFAREKKLSYINYREFKLSNSYFRNSGHLNTKGAILFTDCLFNNLYKKTDLINANNRPPHKHN